MKDDTATQDPQTAVAPATPFEMITAAIITSAVVNKMPVGADPIQEAKQVYARMLRYVGRLK